MDPQAPVKLALSPWGQAAAGATSAVIANALVYPLDMIKTRLQVQVKPGTNAAAVPDSDDTHYASVWDALSKIVAEDGVPGLYTGMTGALLGVASTNFAYFYWYSVVRAMYMSRHRVTRPPGTAVELSLGAIAGAIAQVCTIPVAVVTTRQQTQSKSEKKGLLETAREITTSEDGYSGLWRGLRASLVLVINPAITYGAYQRLKDVLYPERISLRPSEAFALGAISKALATLVTQPMIVAKVGMQSKPPPSRQGKPFNSFMEVLHFVVVNEGYLSLFKGIIPQVVKGFLVQGLLMMSKERLQLLFVALFRAALILRSRLLVRLSRLDLIDVKHIVPVTTR